MVDIEKKRADVGIGPYKIVVFVARAKASDFCPAMPFFNPAGGRITPYTVGAAICRPHGKKKKADLKRNRLLVENRDMDRNHARGQCHFETVFAPEKLRQNGSIYFNIPSAMRRFNSQRAVLLLSY